MTIEELRRQYSGLTLSDEDLDMLLLVSESVRDRVATASSNRNLEAKEKVLKANEEARNAKEEALRAKEEARNVKEEVLRLKDEARNVKEKATSWQLVIAENGNDSDASERSVNLLWCT